MRDYRNERESSFGLARQHIDWKARQGRGHDVYAEDISAKTVVQVLVSIVFGCVVALSLFYWIAK